MIRQAQLEDYEDIEEIKNSLRLDIHNIKSPQYRYDIQRQGFLMPGDFSLDNLAQEVNHLFLVYEENGKVLGYFHVNDERMENDSGTHWYDPKLKKDYFSLPHACIGGLAVSPKNTRHLIATKLLEEGCKILKNQLYLNLFSFISVSPLMNIPSLLFHERMGFDRIMISDPESLFGLQNYQCFLYRKQL
jgi:GNAT superfamily N-acetyltransferase